ncbi:MAG: 23S rRNA (adenine(2503)-C(2))-methyltransferase RlmN [Thermoanaerobacterales bacterium]|nr:23S rRNA (adenine(2503)-C(2))-methyltransferase RlmN [Bacillota bacterium]MDI6907883.1 23S rRNA (adenine(2503)-C(2))-methyltransferase RlmN [Thermoanaerobacterales bacterium]
MPADLKSMTLAGIEELVGSWGWPRYRARQLAVWLWQKGALSFQEMTDLPLAARQMLNERAVITRLELLERLAAPDGETVKFLFGLADGQGVETVLLRHDYGRSVCLSTQVGCRMGCAFCASTLGGRVRDLTAGEIYDQVLAVRRCEGEQATHIVLMGIGEPLDNLAAVLVFLENVSAPYGLGISPRRITLSTCGLVPRIRDLASYRLGLTLAVSLHAPNNELRDRLVPINRWYPLEELIPACRDYARATGRRVTFEYALIKGVNDSDGHALQLGALLKGILGHVNLIPVNDVPERGFTAPGAERVNAFRRILERQGMAVTVRREMGAAIGAACGQLRRRRGPGRGEEPA